MATRREVELVLSARDNTKGAINRVEKNIDDFRKSLAGIKDRAQTVDEGLKRVGTAFTTLKGQIQQAGGLDLAAKAFKDITRSTEQLKQKFADSRGELSTYTKNMYQAADALAKAEVAERKLAATLNKTKASYSQNAAELKRLETTNQTAQKSFNQLNKQIATKHRAFSKAKEQINKYSLEILDLIVAQEKAGSGAAKFESRIQRKRQSIATAEQRVRGLKTEMSELASELLDSESALERSNAAVEKQSKVVTRQKGQVQALTQEWKESASVLSAASNHHAKLQQSVEKTNRAVLRQKNELKQANQATLQSQNEISRLAQAFSRADQAVRAKFLPAVREQAERLQQVKRQMRDTSQAAQKLGNELSKARQPSKDLVQAFERARTAASAARQEFRSQGAALNQMRREMLTASATTGEVDQKLDVLRATLQNARTGATNLASGIRAASSALAQFNDPARRAAENTARFNRHNRNVRASTRQAARGVNSLAQAFRRFYGDSRRALSVLQRIRGEILSLAAAYGGLFAALRGIQAITDSANIIHAATNRLGVVFDGNREDIALELDFIRRNAERLGIQFGVLAQEYTKFSIATKGTNLEGKETRDIFKAVAEAARVNGASLDELKGTFVALTQIVSKGAFSMEEVRQQLGDRLPGAVRILADAVGVTTEELYKMIEQGQLSSDYLKEFAEELERRFGKQLPEALQLLATSIGRLENEAFLALNRVGNAGAVRGFQHFLDTLTETLGSPQFSDFLDRIGKGLELLSAAGAKLVENWRILLILIGTFISSRLGVFIGVLFGRFTNLLFGTTSLITAWTKLRGVSVFLVTAFKILTGASTTLSTRLYILRGAITAITSPAAIGIAFTVLTGLFLTLATRAKDVTEILHEHQKIVDDVRNAYDNLGESVETVRKALEGVTVLEASNRFSDLSANLSKARAEFNAIARKFADPEGFLPRSPAEVSFREGIDSLLTQFDNKKIGVETFRKEVSKLGSSVAGCGT